jgi:hypothetical protein
MDIQAMPFHEFPRRRSAPRLPLALAFAVVALAVLAVFVPDYAPDNSRAGMLSMVVRSHEAMAYAEKSLVIENAKIRYAGRPQQTREDGLTTTIAQDGAITIEGNVLPTSTPSGKIIFSPILKDGRIAWACRGEPGSLAPASCRR